MLTAAFSKWLYAGTQWYKQNISTMFELPVYITMCALGDALVCAKDKYLQVLGLGEIVS